MLLLTGFDKGTKARISGTDMRVAEQTYSLRSDLKEVRLLGQEPTPSRTSTLLTVLALLLITGGIGLLPWLMFRHTPLLTAGVRFTDDYAFTAALTRKEWGQLTRFPTAAVAAEFA